MRGRMRSSGTREGSRIRSCESGSIEMIEQLIKRALEAGFDKAGALDCSTIVLRPEVREACRKNTCGRYGTSWSCPPGCGSLDECAARIRKYSKGLIVQTVEIEDEFDGEGMMAAAERHEQTFRRFAGSCGEYRTCSPWGPKAPAITVLIGFSLRRSARGKLAHGSIWDYGERGLPGERDGLLLRQGNYRVYRLFPAGVVSVHPRPALNSRFRLAP